MATANLTELLDREGIRYITIQHSRAYTAQDEEIAFNAGTHTELIRMPYRDYERVVHPKPIDMRADAG